jgi:hypothetical protein
MGQGKSKRKRITPGLVYNRNGLKIWNPMPAIYTVSVQDAGILSIIVNEHSQAVSGNALPNKGSRYTYAAGGIRSAILHGVQHLYVVAHKFYDVKKIEAVLDEVGVNEERNGYISTATHKKLTQIVAALTRAAQEGGISKLEEKLHELGAAHKHIKTAV